MKKPNITGIIHKSILLVEACCSETDGMVVIFCMTNMETPTRTGIIILVGSGKARSIQRKLPFSGTDWWASGNQA